MSARWESALVTGASSGIGRAVTRQLVRDGVAVVAVARDVGRLEQLATELNGEPGAIGVLRADLTEPAELRKVEDRLADSTRPVDLLVNNAGFGTYGRFSELDVDGEEREVRLNVVAVVRLAHAALRAMAERKRGTVVNLGSIAGLQPTPGNATYGATKAFVASFSEALHEEVRGTGVTVTVVLPGFTRTEFQQRAGIEGRAIPGPAWQSAEACAAEILGAARAGKAVHVPGRLNRLGVALHKPLPRGLARRAAARFARRL